jgi:hypothetical protein
MTTMQPDPPGGRRTMRVGATESREEESRAYTEAAALAASPSVTAAEAPRHDDLILPGVPIAQAIRLFGGSVTAPQRHEFLVSLSAARILRLYEHPSATTQALEELVRAAEASPAFPGANTLFREAVGGVPATTTPRAGYGTRGTTVNSRTIVEQSARWSAFLMGRFLGISRSVNETHRVPASARLRGHAVPDNLSLVRVNLRGDAKLRIAWLDADRSIRARRRRPGTDQYEWVEIVGYTIGPSMLASAQSNPVSLRDLVLDCVNGRTTVQLPIRYSVVDEAGVTREEMHGDLQGHVLDEYGYLTRAEANADEPSEPASDFSWP